MTAKRDAFHTLALDHDRRETETPGGRRQPLARAISEYAKLHVQTRGERDVTIEEALACVDRDTLSRRDLLRIGGVLGTGLALTGITGRAAMAASAGTHITASGASRPTPHDARVVIVGAGLAGLTSAYRLAQQGVHVELFESRDRVGGRCWTSRGWADGQTAEHGGEFIDTRHVHLLQLARELGLEVDDLYAGYPPGSVWLNFVDGQPVRYGQLGRQLHPVVKQIIEDAKRIGVYDHAKASDAAYSHGTATRQAIAFDQMSMLDWLDRHFPGTSGAPLGHYLDEIMEAWYGLGLHGLSALNWIDYFLIPSPGGDERWHIRGGNDLVTSRAARRLPDGALRLETPLEAIRQTSNGEYELRFTGQRPVRADFAILALPFTTLRDVDFSQAGFGSQTTSAIEHLGMGTDGKVLLQYDRRFNTFRTTLGRKWSGGMEHTGPNFETWESSTDEAGASGLLTVYPGGRSGAITFAAPGVIHGTCPEPLRSRTVGSIDVAVPGTAAHFNGRSWVDWWTGDPWTLGSYAAFRPGQITRFWHGVGPPEGRCHFAGEHTSTYSQGFLNGGVESGDRAAIEVMRALGIRVPRSIANLPYSTFT